MAVLNDADFIDMFRQGGASNIPGSNERNAYARRTRLEKKYNIQIDAPDLRPAWRTGRHTPTIHPKVVEIEIKNGVALIGSDAHYWPGDPSVGHRAFVRFAKELKPKALILNGDAIDAGSISRHPPIAWEKQPDLIDEIETAQERLHEIRLACPKNCRTTWNLGNHDARFETRLATMAPQYARIHGVHLKDHFPEWEPTWSTWINNDVVVKHRFKGGMHAPQNNTLWSGKTTVTGHLHSAKVMPITDYNGTRYGVDTGCLADIFHPAFEYMEDNPRNWRSAFGVFTFKDGKLLQPELVLAWDDQHVEFRGELIKV